MLLNQGETTEILKLVQNRATLLCTYLQLLLKGWGVNDLVGTE